MNNFVNTTFCRLCLNITEGQQTADLAGDKQVCTILESVFPGMQLDLIPTPKICLTCKEKLQFAYIFKNTVLRNEQKIDFNKESFAIVIDMCRLCLKEKFGKDVVYLYENNCSYSYQLIRTVTEIATVPLNFDIFQKPIMCTECWSTVKDTYAFKKRCFDNEEKLRNFSKKSNNGLNSLSVEEVLTAINRREKVSDSHFDNDLPDFKNKDEYSDSECSEDIFDEEVNDDVVEIRIKNRKHVDDTKLNNINLKNYDSIIDVGKSENHRILAEVTELVREELVKQEISVEEHDIGHNGFAAFKEESKSSIWETLGETSLVTPSNYLNVEAETSKQHTSSHASNPLTAMDKSLTVHLIDCIKYQSNLNITSLVTPSNYHNVKAETTKQRTSSHASNPLTGMDKSLTIHLIDCIKYQSNLNIRNISTETENISHPHPELKSNNNSLKRTIKCGDCEFVTSSKDTMTRHMEKHILYSDTGNKCPNCQKVYRNPDILEEHIQSCKSSLREKESPKTLSKTFQKCGKCSFSTIWPQIFKRHMSQHVKNKTCNNNHSNKSFICYICRRGFKTRDLVREHLMTHSTDRNYICDICDKAFKARSNLRLHHFTHSEDREFICDVCQQGFKRNATLKEHKKIHCDTKDYICDTCQKCFRYRRLLIMHMEMHRSDKSFICDICRKSFKTKNLVRYHLMTHSEDRKFICDVCQKGFKRNTTLKDHKTIHYDAKDYICHICQKCFKCRANRTAHLTTHRTDKSFICHICQKSFKTRKSVRAHITSHRTDINYICDICKKAFKTRYNVRRHHMRKHLKPSPHTL